MWHQKLKVTGTTLGYLLYAAVEDGAVVITLLGQLEEIIAMKGSLDVEADTDVAK